MYTQTETRTETRQKTVLLRQAFCFNDAKIITLSECIEENKTAPAYMDIKA